MSRSRARPCRKADARRRCEAEAEPGWLCGLPVAIKDLTDVAGVRTTYGSPIFRDHVPTRSHPVVERIERRGGIVIAKRCSERLLGRMRRLSRRALQLT